jgi:hypothetical protein
VTVGAVRSGGEAIAMKAKPVYWMCFTMIWHRSDEVVGAHGGHAALAVCTSEATSAIKCVALYVMHASNLTAKSMHAVATVATKSMHECMNIADQT